MTANCPLPAVLAVGVDGLLAPDWRERGSHVRFGAGASRGRASGRRDAALANVSYPPK